MSSSHAQSNFPLLWISKTSKLPEVCCTCGMFTDHKVKTKSTKGVEVPDGSCLVTFVQIISLFLGPLGWLFAAIVSRSKDDEKTKTVQQGIKVPISQCLLCSGMAPPETVDVDLAFERVAFLVHPEFERRFQQLILEEVKDN